jgi:hypothetical protein
MRAIIAIVCLGLLIWVKPASAQQTYSLTVSRHPEVREFSPDEIMAILDKASKIMQDAACNVTFTLYGPVGKFASDAPAEINSREQRNAVHSENANVKIVKTINYCLDPPFAGGANGCAWPPEQPRPGSLSIILTESGAKLANRWAHELGHRMGLRHRSGRDTRPLMTACGVTEYSVELSQDECNCFFKGPGHCGPPTPLRCPPMIRGWRFQ